MTTARRLALSLAGALALAGCRGTSALVFPAPAEQKVPLLPGASMVRGGQGDRAFLALHRPAAPGHRTVVWLHGNAQQIGDLPVMLHKLSDGKLGLYAVEYPGYGLLGGEPGEGRVVASVDAALGLLHGPLGVPPERVVLVGQSIGTGVAAEMALRGHGARLALLSPFTSLDAVSERFAGWLSRALLVDHLDTLSKAPRIQQPVLLIHGTHDRFIPGWMSQQLEAAFPEAALFWMVGAGHNDLFEGRRAEQLFTLLRLFADEPLPSDHPPGATAQK